MSGKSAWNSSNHWKMWSRPQVADDSGLVDFYPDRVSSAIFAGLRKLHPSKAVTSNLARLWRDGPRIRRAIRPECLARRSLRGGGCAVPIIAAICLFGGKTCRALFLFSRPAPLRLPLRGPSLGSRLRRSADWFSNLRIQSINLTPFAHRFASNAPPRLSALVSPFRARTPVARYAMQASGLVCLWQTPGVSGPPRSARYASSGAALASLFKDHPPDPCARDAHPEDVPRAGSQAPRQQSCHVACLPKDGMR